MVEETYQEVVDKIKDDVKEEGEKCERPPVIVEEERERMKQQSWD